MLVFNTFSIIHVDFSRSYYTRLPAEGIYRSNDVLQRVQIIWNMHIVIWEPEGHYPYSIIFHCESERRYSLYKVYGDSALLVLKLTSLNSVNALLVLSRQYIYSYLNMYFIYYVHLYVPCIALDINAEL